MNEAVKKVCLLCMAGSLLISAFGQETISHQVIFPKGDLQWKVTVESVGKAKSAETSSNQSKAVKEIKIVRVGNLRHDTIVWNDGGLANYWWLNNPPLTLMQGSPGEEIRALKSGLLGPRRFDESTFAWVSAQTFIGLDTFNGKKVRKYQLDTELAEGGVKNEYAMIDAETGQPLAWSDGVQNIVFAFENSAPTEKLELPPDFQQALKRYEAYLAPARRNGKR